MIYCIELHAVKEDIFECTFISDITHTLQTAMYIEHTKKTLDERELNCLWRTLEIDLLKTLLKFGGKFGFLWVLVGTFSSLRKCFEIITRNFLSHFFNKNVFCLQIT